LVLQNVLSHSYSSGVYEFYITENRFVLLKTQPRTNAMAAGGGLVGALITSGIDRVRKKSYGENLSLDEKIRLDSHNYVIPFENVSLISRRKGRLGGGWKEVEIQFTDDKGKNNSARYSFGDGVKVFLDTVSSLQRLQEKVDPSLHESAKNSR